MIRTWKMPTMMFLLSAAAITALPATLFAQAKAPDQIDGLDKLQRAIEALDKKLEQLKKSSAGKKAIQDAIRAELQMLDGPLKEMKNDLAAIRAEQKKALEDQKAAFDLLSAKIDATLGKNAPAVDKAFMEEMKRSMKYVEESVAKLNTNTARLSMYPPANGDGAPKTGRVKFTNNFSTELDFIVNDRAYRVLPGAWVMVNDVPPGPLTYSVADAFGFLVERQAVNLSAGKTLDVTARR